MSDRLYLYFCAALSTPFSTIPELFMNHIYTFYGATEKYISLPRWATPDRLLCAGLKPPLLPLPTSTHACHPHQPFCCILHCSLRTLSSKAGRPMQSDQKTRHGLFAFHLCSRVSGLLKKPLPIVMLKSSQHRDVLCCLPPPSCNRVAWDAEIVHLPGSLHGKHASPQAPQAL